MNFLCPNCKSYPGPGARFCAECGAALTLESERTSGREGDEAGGSPQLLAGLDFNLPFGISLGEGGAILAYAAGGVLLLLMSYNLLSEAFSYPTWQVLLASVAIVIILIKVYSAAGLRALLHYGIYVSIYCAGGVVVLAITTANAAAGGGWPTWQIWLIYTGVYSLLTLVLLPLVRRLASPPRDDQRHRAMANQIEEERIKREAELKLLPSHSWYVLACWVTGVAMLGSFVTTAIGFYQEIVDPYDPDLIRYGIPIGLSAMAAFIIWSGWNFVFLRMRIAKHVSGRVFAFATGFAVIIPLTLAIHTVFGIIGVGGTEGLRSHYTWYAEVLSGHFATADQLREAESGLEQQFQFIATKFADSAEREKAGGSGCGAGQGELFKYYQARAKDVDGILKQIKDRRATKPALPMSFEDLRRNIRNPGKKFKSAQGELERNFTELRSKILELESRSILASLRVFSDQLAIVLDEGTFFRYWPDCQQKRKDIIQAEVKQFLKSVKDSDEKVAAIRADGLRHIPPEHRVESFPWFDFFIRPATAEPVAASNQAINGAGAQTDSVPMFMPMRPFWAVVSYASQLPGYVALQLALDFSPAILGVLFAMMAPLPRGPTLVAHVVTPVFDVAYDRWQGWWERRRATKGMQVALGSKDAGPPSGESGLGLAPQPIVVPNAPADTKTPVIPLATMIVGNAKVDLRERVQANIGSLERLFRNEESFSKDDLDWLENLLGDTHLSKLEREAMKEAVERGILQRILARPEQLTEELALQSDLRDAIHLWTYALALPPALE